jgi:hypothetical protein
MQPEPDMRHVNEDQGVLPTAGRMCRTVAVALIAGVRRRESIEEIEARVVDLPRGDQALIVGTTLGGLFLLSLIAAQFGLIGLALYLLAIVFIVN